MRSPPPLTDPVAFPLGNAQIGPAGGSQYNGVLSQGDDQLLAGWVDGRDGAWGCRWRHGWPPKRLRSNQYRPDLAGNEAMWPYASRGWNGSNWLVAWIAKSRVTNQFQLVAARIAPSGSVVDAAPILVAESPDRQEQPAVTSDGTNWIVVWRRDSATGGTRYILGSRSGRMVRCWTLFP